MQTASLGGTATGNTWGTFPFPSLHINLTQELICSRHIKKKMFPGGTVSKHLIGQIRTLRVQTESNAEI